MSQSLVNNHIHLVYSTKGRLPLISQDVRDRLSGYQAGIFKQLDSPAIVIGGVEDHVHTLFRLSKNLPLIKVVEEVNKSSSKWMKSQGPLNHDFCWQTGYAAFSVSQSNLETVEDYIKRQQEHHQKSSFQDDLRALCTRHQIEWDERYIWD